MFCLKIFDDNYILIYLELVEVCPLRGCETPLGLRVRGPSRMAGVDLRTNQR